ncbi:MULTISPECIES: methyltransferase type 12 [Rhizobium]|jgi:tRNA (mo5U34)-methyltransferase|uniref:methyltransferase type 12 n=1 Tax=Rhizobium TaxID=379 RepID=UPI0003710977|nr:methyltransferase type 12 [Rhizobium leguminosarum]MBA8836022.1 tRNA (mo5U34)-methyltransferase [Rhizobium leguminosarum]MDH6275650.1 2-polyprenyl-3-methyl-5-hydroxy-6-metoxy-1,4-benzoquinol methylase [Rhizobium leguminosarum]MVO95926.1 methyltransferase type 12 [Rhizobium leguminosarum bv. phaseoli]
MDVLKKILSSFSGASAKRGTGAHCEDAAPVLAAPSNAETPALAEVEIPAVAEVEIPAVGEVEIPGIDTLPDDELERLNKLLPWAAFVLDRKGRKFGVAHSVTKRNLPQAMPDPRIVELDRRIPLRDLTVFEIGCFEGIHTAALAMHAKHVLACDSRIENVVKTIVRCAMYGTSAHIFRWDAEENLPVGVSLDCDVLHHVGVLYHLTDPVGHLKTLLPHVRKAVMLDTQIAPEDARSLTYETGGRTYRYHHYREAGRDAPFAGMLDHAKWMFKDDLLALLSEAGFDSIDVANFEIQRNGPRILIYATRSGSDR